MSRLWTSVLAGHPLEQNRKDPRTSKAKHEDLMSLLLAPEIDEEHNDYGCWYVEYACFED
jgi:hypothetical protein